MDRLSANQWALGPAVVGLFMPGHFVMGAVVSNVWNIGGGYGVKNPQSVNQMTLQYFITFNMERGWYLKTAPVITANWEADSGNEWTVPFGVGGGRVFKIGNQHVNAGLYAYYSVWRPDDASDWNIQFSWTFMFPE